MRNKIARYAFLIGAGIALFGALIHLIAPLIGPDWYAFLTSPAWVVESARAGTLLAPVGAAVIGLLMLICALYAFSGTGLLARLPLLKTGLVVIATICLLRGLLLFPLLLKVPELLTGFDIVASLVWLSAGLAFFIGTIIRWQELKRHDR